MAIPSLSSANEALSLVGRLTDLIKKGATIDLHETIVNLREAVLALKEENLNLKEQVSALGAAIQREKDLVFEAPCYYSQTEDGTKDGPFCQVCQNNDRKLVRLIVQEQGSWHCGVCKGYFETQQHKAMSDARIRAHNNSLQGNW